MENAVEALKIAGAVLMFVLALTLGISSLSKANNTVDSVVRMRDKDTLTEYEIVKPSKDLTRNVGAETIVATMYRAYEEDIEIYFKNADGTDLPIYYKTDSSGNKKIDSNGNEITVNYINKPIYENNKNEEESYESKEEQTRHLDIILGTGKNKNNGLNLSDKEQKKYGNQLYYEDGFYQYLTQHEFKEEFGQYLLGNEATATRRGVITYTLVK
mgnify:CR=1 FL=1